MLCDASERALFCAALINVLTQTCFGERNTWSRLPRSTTRPSFMTTTSLQSRSTTAGLWEMTR